MVRLTPGTFLRDLRAQRLRLILTLFGIVWGTVAVVVLLAFGMGLERQAQAEMGAGQNLVLIYPGRTSLPYRGFPAGRWIRLQPGDGNILKSEIAEIALISEVSNSARVVRSDNRSERPQVYGIEPDYQSIRQLDLYEGGRFISPRDMAMRRRVAVLGRRLKEDLFKDEAVIGRQVLVGTSSFTVIGVVDRESGFGSGNQVFVPATTYHTLYGTRSLSSLAYSPVSPGLAPRALERSRQTLGSLHRFDPADQTAFWTGGSFQMDEEIRAFFVGLKLFLATVGSFTLVVGGIGVANIMFVVVRERRREIGVKRAIGARRADIMIQFLLETALLVAIGGALGILIAAGMVNVLALLPFMEEVGQPVLSGAVAAVTISALGAIAFIAGIFPARKAARLDPVAALRG